MTMQRIQQLDNQLANQIAAGEVVERPASVVKELIENCVDAGATRIDIEIERGGTRLIRIIDDGHGIHKDDLPLALARHATSKIRSFNELCAVSSLGFRGEALASIASVSRLLLRTRLHDEKQGWQAEAEGREMAVNVSPASAVAGTCIEVRDLFFNTPARRKFLRTEKTELTHIEDVVKREALATPSVAFVLKHNGKIVKRYPAANDEKRLLEKMSVACGKKFLQQSVGFSGALDSLTISGRLALPSYHRSESDSQFLFVNGRPVKDRLLSHAIRQSYHDHLPQGRFASYIVYIECEAQDVDVNVHPTKHEVRFRQPRQVHDFLSKLVNDCLQQSGFELTHNDTSDESSFYSEAGLAGASNSNHRSSTATMMASQRIVDHSQDTIERSQDSIERSQDSIESRQLAKGVHPAHPFRSQPTSYSVSGSRPSFEQVNEIRQFHDDQKHAQDTDESNLLTHSSPSGENVSNGLWQHRFATVYQKNTLQIVDAWRWFVDCWRQQWHSGSETKPVLIPKMLPIAFPEQWEDDDVFGWFAAFGIDLSPAGPEQIMLRKLPSFSLPIPSDVWIDLLSQCCIQRWQVNNAMDIKHRLLALAETLTLNQSDWLYDWFNNQMGSSNEWQKFSWELSVQDILRNTQ